MGRQACSLERNWRPTVSRDHVYPSLCFYGTPIGGEEAQVPRSCAHDDWRAFDAEYSEIRFGSMLVFTPARRSCMADPDLAFAAFVLFVLIATLLFSGGPGTPRRMRSCHSSATPPRSKTDLYRLLFS